MQSLMRRFAELAPYNFIHVMRIAGRADANRWREAAGLAISELGIGPPQFDGEHFRFLSTARPSIEIAGVDLDRHLDAELNRPFSPDEIPLRFFIIENPDDTHWFGVVIDHWMADDFSCRQLLRRIFLRYHSSENAAALPPLSLANSSAPRSPATFLRSFPGLIRQLAEHRQAFRVSLRDPCDFAARTFRQDLPNGLIEPLRQRAKQHGATVHDLFLIACAQCCGEFRQRHPEGSREGVGLATVANLRPLLRRDVAPETAFGCFLSYYTVTLANPERISPLELLDRVTSRTKRLKAGMQTTFGNLEFARRWWDRSPSARAKGTLFQRSVPTMCGLSNVNLIGSWIEHAHPQLIEYRRVGPAGPITPLVFMLTSIGDRLSIDVTYRTTAFTQGDAEQVTARFSTCLQALVA